MSETISITYTGPTPGADSLVYTLFSTAPTTATGNTAGSAITLGAFPAAKYLAMLHMKRLQLGLIASAAGTLNWYKSNSRSGGAVNPSSSNTTMVWTQIGTSALSASATVENTFDFLIEEYDDFKLDLVNGGSAQTTFVVNMALSDERNKST